MSVVSAAFVAGRYRLERRVAADASGEVWQGTDVELARPVAVKLLDVEPSSAEAMSHFRAAVRRAGSLAHQGLVRVFDYGEPGPSGAEQRPFVVMEYVDGPSLAALLEAGPLGAARTVDIVAQAAAALQAVHGAGLAHGDIKPSKVLLSRGGAAKLFGFSGSCPAGPAAIGADLRALGALARQCLGDPAAADGDLPGPLTESVADLVADLCANPLADQAAATAAIAGRAAALSARLGAAAAQSTRLGHPTPARSAPPPADPTAVAPASPPVSPRLRRPAATATTEPLPRLKGRASVPAAGRIWGHPGPPPEAAGHKHATRVSAAAVRTAAVIAIAIAAVAVYPALTLRSGGTAAPADGAASATPVHVTAARLIGLPLHQVRLRLQRLGLIVRIRWQPSTHITAGRVIAVRPAGLVPAHSIITITGSSGPPATTPLTTRQPAKHRNRRSSPAPSNHATKTTPKPSHSASTSPAPSPSPSNTATPTPSPSPSNTTSPPPSTSSSPPASPTSPPPGRSPQSGLTDGPVVLSRSS